MTEVAGSKRAQITRAALLEAAREVFSAAGYDAANMVDIADRAGASIGSLYHHFAAKSDLYITLYNEYQRRQQHRSAQAFRTALDRGEKDALQLFIIGTRAYLEGCWEERELATMFLSGGGPAGFGLLTRQRFREWLHANSTLTNGHTRPLSEMLVLCLTAMATEAGREVASAPSRAKARRMVDEVLELMRRLYPSS
ncbi:TetR/AcrR family transcriptional regulator [Amycolatopsis acidiphila]|uniref:TetR/AcrR family transcriptional regulator n=1 Tax=Amycolatopsis acidiphila TaxID=715473 RepID=A0A558AAN0_9PSEU|nr:TetR/AcrR family transcriptional regulator [Amycolatopsis acidiphila]TVT21307.1 TetR/AcrR family transcriptional regulator [Amycolatopsis acidiphila]UIJ63520.1 TetR/AcrR family transcriptional regulator [Amycolatopsis acidiphila]